MSAMEVIVPAEETTKPTEPTPTTEPSAPAAEVPQTETAPVRFFVFDTLCFLTIYWRLRMLPR
jgi:hypothetical protein